MYNRLFSEHDNDFPDSAKHQEEFLIQDIEAARMEIAELERKRSTLFRLQEEAAIRKCDLDSANEFSKLQRIWRREPVFGRDMLGSNWRGAAMLAGLWAAILRVINEAEAPVALDEARELLLAEGFSDKIQQQTPESWWIISRCLAMHPEPETAICEWIRRSRAADKLVETRRAMNAYAEAPGTEKSREDLLKLALEREAFWIARSNELKKEHETRRELYRTGLQADRQITSSIRTLQGFLKHERARLSRLVKERRQVTENLVRLEERARLNAEKAAARQGRRDTNQASKKSTTNESRFAQDESQIETSVERYTSYQSAEIGDNLASIQAHSSESECRKDSIAEIAPENLPREVQILAKPEIDPMIIQLLSGWTDEDLTRGPDKTKVQELFRMMPQTDERTLKQLTNYLRERKEAVQLRQKSVRQAGRESA